MLLNMRTDEQDVDLLTFVSLAAVTANVIVWLRSEACSRDQNAEQGKRGEQNSECGNDERAHVRSASMPCDDDRKDRNDEAERESDLNAGGQIVATTQRLESFACLSV